MVHVSARLLLWLLIWLWHPLVFTRRCGLTLAISLGSLTQLPFWNGLPGQSQRVKPRYRVKAWRWQIVIPSPCFSLFHPYKTMWQRRHFGFWGSFPSFWPCGMLCPTASYLFGTVVSLFLSSMQTSSHPMSHQTSFRFCLASFTEHWFQWSLFSSCFFPEAMLKGVYFSTIVKNLVHLPNKKVFLGGGFTCFNFQCMF